MTCGAVVRWHREARGRASSLAFCVVLLLGLAGCWLPVAVRPTVKIGLVAPFEGRYRYVGYDVIYAARLALREVNAVGGVGGYSVELVAYNDSAAPATAVEQVHKLAVDPEVVVVIGHFREETTAAAVDVYREAGIPLVSPAALEPLADAWAGEVLGYFEKASLGRVALVTQGGPLGVAVTDNARRSRVSVVPVVHLPGDGDWVAGVLASGVQAVVCDAVPETCGEAVAALRDAGWEGPFLGGPELAAVDFASVAGEGAGGTLFVTPWPFPQDVPDGAGFVAAYEAVSNGVPPGPLALPAYEAVWLGVDALEQEIAAHGEPTRQGVAMALASTEQGGVAFYWYRVHAGGAAERVP